MNIFAAAADYMSWASLLGVKPGDAPPTSFFDQNVFYLGAQPSEIKIPVSGNKVFVKLGLANLSLTEYNDQFYYSYGDKFFTVYDSNGKLRVSLEKVMQYYGLNGNAAYRWKTWNPDTGTVINTGAMWLGVAWESWKDIYFEVTTNAVKFYITGQLINTLDISSLGITGFAKIGFGKQLYWYNEAGMTDSRPRFLYLVVSDTVDYSLRAYPYKPKALDSSNQFTGTIDKLNSWIPDRSYMSSSAEYNVKCAFNLSVPASGYYYGSPGPDLTVEKILQMDQYIGARYVQSGGVAANYRIHNTVDGGPDDYVFSCPANEDDTKSIFRKVPSTKTGTDLPNPANGLVEIYLEA